MQAEPGEHVGDDETEVQVGVDAALRTAAAFGWHERPGARLGRQRGHQDGRAVAERPDAADADPVGGIREM